MAWLFLLIAAFFEVLFAMSMKYANGFTQPLPSALVVLAAIAGIYFLTLAMRVLPVSVAYPIWTAIGTLGTVILGVALLASPSPHEAAVGGADHRRGSGVEVTGRCSVVTGM